jgi:hypothetical protein
MIHRFKLFRRIFRFRAPVFGAIILSVAACDANNPTDPITNDQPVAAPEAGPEAVSFSSAFRGGIPIGFFRLPTSALGSTYSGGRLSLEPKYALKTLMEVRARGGKVLIQLAGLQSYYKDARGHFSFTKWKARINRFRGINLTPFILSGTVAGHYLIDEPQDKKNWNGQPIPGATLEQMAKYSKQLWPGMVTIVRAPPGKIKWGGTYHYLDAAWAQVENPRGNLNVKYWFDQNVAAARSQGLALVVGLNVTKGNRNFTQMTPAQVRSWGSVLLNSSYPCAFISWKYVDAHMASASMKDAMRYLRTRAENRPAKSCRGT